MATIMTMRDGNGKTKDFSPENWQFSNDTIGSIRELTTALRTIRNRVRKEQALQDGIMPKLQYGHKDEEQCRDADEQRDV